MKSMNKKKKKVTQLNQTVPGDNAAGLSEARSAQPVWLLQGGINSIDFPPVPDNSELCELNQEEAQWRTGRCF